jgi:TetR/AcrR family transcriptional repressor of nem operon
MRTATLNSASKARLLDAAERLMLAQGFEATTVDEICEAAKLTKGSFFHYFDSKEDLGRQVLERFCASAERLHADCCSGSSDPLERVYSYIDGSIQLSREPRSSQGCLLGSFAQELCESHPAIRQACERGFAEWRRQFGEELGRAKAKYAPRAAFKPQELAEHFIAILEGSLILGKASQDRAVVARNLRHFKAYVRQLFGR